MKLMTMFHLSKNKNSDNIRLLYKCQILSTYFYQQSYGYIYRSGAYTDSNKCSLYVYEAFAWLEYLEMLKPLKSVK